MTAMFKGLKTGWKQNTISKFKPSNLLVLLGRSGKWQSWDAWLGWVGLMLVGFFLRMRKAWFWAVTDFVLTVGGLGDWRTDGCHITGVFRNFTTVHCSHLSIFAIIEVRLQIIVSALVSQKNNEETYFFFNIWFRSY